MVAVPVDTPVTMPVLLTVAIPAALLLHTPPVVASVKGVVAPVHTVAVPVMVPALGKGFTVTTAVALPLPQLLVTV